MTNQMIDILSPSGSLIRQHILSANCVRKFSLMNEDSVTLRFWTREAMQFPVGSSVGDFFITQEQVGKWNESTGVWEYELKFDAYYWLWANKILRYIIPNVDSARETSFTLTATINVHASVILNCLGFLGFEYGGSPFRVDTTDTSLSQEAKLVRYENLSILGGIEAIAEAFGCEWWVIGNAIYFGRCENSLTEHVFEAGVNVSSISFSQAKSGAPNRLYVYGSDRNLPTNYRAITGNDTIGGVVAKRLMLPEGTPYLQTNPDIPENQIVEKVAVLDSVYPRTDLTVSDEPETYTSTIEDEEGYETSETFYRLKYGDSFLFSEDYVLPNEELHIIFQSGLLNGMEFGAKFNPKGLNEKNSDGSWNPEAQMIEVVVNEDYGRRLPDDILKPQKGDKFILSGWDSTKMAELGLIADAEQELLEEGQKALEEYTKDLSSCTCPMAWNYMKPLLATNSQPKPGDVVTIIDTAHFGEGGRKSRIIGFEYKIDKPYAEYIYTCGENVSVKRLDSIEKKIEGLAKSGTKVQLQNSLDFLSKRYSDRTPYALAVGGTLTAEDIVRCKEFMAGLMGWQIDKIGNAEFESGVFRSFLQIYELIVNRQRTIEGDVLMSEGDTIEEVIPLGISDEGNERYTLKLHEEWEGYTTAQYEENVCKGIYNDITQRLEEAGEGETRLNNATYATSWFKVLAVRPESNEIDVVMYPDDEVPAGRNFAPRPMMKFARWGNAGSQEEQLRRQEVLYFSSTEGRIMKLFRVTKPIIDQGNVAMVMGTVPEFLADGVPGINPGENIGYFKTVIAERFVTSPYAGRPQALIVFRGDWDPDEMYYDGTEWVEDSGGYERSVVVYYGCQWICAKKGTQNHPSWDSVDWALYLGDPSLKLSWTGSEDSVYESNPEITLEAAANICYMDVTDDPQIKWDWERYSERDGVRDTADDDLWTAAHQNLGNRLELTVADMNYQFGNRPDKLAYKLTATLIDKNGLPATYTRGNPSDTMEVIF